VPLGCVLGHSTPGFRLIIRATTRLGRRPLVAAVLVAAALGALLCTPARAGSADAPPSVEAITPVELRVPAARIDAAVQVVSTTDDGSMDVPSNFTDVAWYGPGYRPGQLGHAVFDGHVSNVDSAAVFFYVEDLSPGDSVYVTGDDGTTLQFAVTDVESYPLDDTPMDQIFGPSDWPEVVLITCGGDWHPDVHLFDHRTVVYASLVGG
jgi:sortase A